MESSAQREFRNSLGMTFVYIDSGTFMMGSPKEETGRYDDEILHRVTLTNGFYMQTTPVTVGQWQKFVDATDFLTQAEKEDGAIGFFNDEWKKEATCHWRTPGFDPSDDHPVTCVSMHDIQAFIGWLSEGTESYRLPTEAEWEYACRAGSTTSFTFGKCLSPEDANFNDAMNPLTGCRNSGLNREQTTPVGMFKENQWGLHDMHGNVLERCQDQCDWDKESDSIISDTYTENIIDPLCCQGSLQIARGGGWSADAKHSRAACRIKYDPNDRYSFLGFRLVSSSV